MVKIPDPKDVRHLMTLADPRQHETSGGASAGKAASVDENLSAEAEEFLALISADIAATSERVVPYTTEEAAADAERLTFLEACRLG